MTIELSRADGAWTYRISPTDPLLLERRENKHGARWLFWLRRDTPGEAQRALLEIGREGERK